MEKLTKRKEAVLEILDEQIADLEEKLKPAEKLLAELNKLRQTRRVLLDERAVTGGGGNSRVQLSMESVIHHMREHDATEDDDGRVQPADIATALGVPGATVRSHLARHKGTRYERDDEGWFLIGKE